MTILSAFKTPSYTFATGGVLMIALAATGCQYTAESGATTPNPSTSNTSTTVAPDISQQTLKQQALRLQRALANNDFSRITDDIHPTRGVRFSMYAYVRPKTDKVFSRAQYAQYLQQSKVRFTWGDLDGTGDSLVIPLPEYLDTWVASEKYNTASVSVNEFKHSGNMINNLKETYPNSEFVEFYHKGSEEYAGMDWRILRLVFEEYQGKRYLVAIVNEQWTV